MRQARFSPETMTVWLPTLREITGLKSVIAHIAPGSLFADSFSKTLIKQLSEALRQVPGRVCHLMCRAFPAF